MDLFYITITFLITIILMRELVRQTMRAERLEAALARVEAVIAETEKAAIK